MEMKLKKIAVDMSLLEDVIGSDCIYVDKTRYALKMINSGKYYFLSRPRRFGKSLMVDTLANIFSGNKELFKETYIYDKYDFEKYPVINFSMISVNGHNLELVQELLMKQIRQIGRALRVYELMDLSVATPSSLLESLIVATSERYDKKVVILIDEYDYPLLENMTEDCFSSVQTEMANFYNILKAVEKNIKFCFITGVSRFPHVSIFSKLNNLIDISNDPEYSAICGYTDEEIDGYFAPYMEDYFENNDIAYEDEKKEFRNRMREYYDGYRFSIDSDISLYNPVSIGKFFIGNCRFKNFWVGTGAQSLVNEVVRRHPVFFEENKRFEIGSDTSSQLELKNLFRKDVKDTEVYSFLLQAGYLTIKGHSGKRYELYYPNLEVKDTMETELLSSTYSMAIFSDDIMGLRDYFRAEDTNNIIDTFKKFYVGFPYDMQLEKERGYHVAFVAVLKALGLEKVEAEEKTNIGRIDISVEVYDGLYYIIELKLDLSADAALRQIKRKKYYEKYMKRGNTIHLLGINFSSKERNIVDWKEEISLFD